MKKTILIWDIENISISYIKDIFNNLLYKPDISYAISKQIINTKKQNILKEYNIKIIQTKNIADDFIMFLLKINLETKSNFIIISSNSDFCKFSKLAYQKDKNIQWFLTENNKKAILMENNLTYKNIKYVILKNYKNKSKNPKKIKNDNSRKKISGLTSKLSLSTLEDMFKKQNLIQKTEINLMKERNEFIIKQIKHRINNFYSNHKIGTCECCGSINKQIRKDYYELCSLCEQKFVLNYSKLKNLTHEEKLINFMKDTEKEISINGTIIYSEESYLLDLLQKELNAQINLPNKYKMENIKYIENIN